MGKGNRLKKLRKKSGESPAAKASGVFTKTFQKELRDSKIWDEMVVQFGEKRALELLSECKAEVKTGKLE